MFSLVRKVVECETWETCKASCAGFLFKVEYSPQSKITVRAKQGTITSKDKPKRVNESTKYKVNEVW